jgi:hypothetical protein
MRILIVAAALTALAACNQETADTTPDTTMSETTAPTTSAAPTTVMVTETDARTRLEGEGYTNVTGLMQNPDGTWTATGTRNGQTTQVTVSDTGVHVGTTSTTTTTTP